MDKSLPENFEPATLVDDPMQQPAQSDNEHDQGGGSKQNRADDTEGPMHNFLPASLKRVVVAGSCCTGVAALYFLTSWDHGWIPGLESQFALASDVRKVNQEYGALKSDVAELYTLSIARAIRDLQADICIAPSISKAEQLDALQYKYKQRTGERYPPTVCPD